MGLVSSLNVTLFSTLESALPVRLTSRALGV